MEAQSLARLNGESKLLSSPHKTRGRSYSKRIRKKPESCRTRRSLLTLFVSSAHPTNADRRQKRICDNRAGGFPWPVAVNARNPPRTKCFPVALRTHRRASL